MDPKTPPHGDDALPAISITPLGILALMTEGMNAIHDLLSGNEALTVRESVSLAADIAAAMRCLTDTQGGGPEAALANLTRIRRDWPQSTTLLPQSVGWIDSNS